MPGLVDDLVLQLYEQRGWRRCNTGELCVIIALEKAGVGPAEVVQQFNLGGYHIDFAFVRERIAIEADGWVHTARGNAERDRYRDKKLVGWGWLTCRIDTDAWGQDEIDAQVGAIVLACRATQEAHAFFLERHLEAGSAHTLIKEKIQELVWLLRCMNPRPATVTRKVKGLNPRRKWSA